MVKDKIQFLIDNLAAQKQKMLQLLPVVKALDNARIDEDRVFVYAWGLLEITSATEEDLKVVIPFITEELYKTFSEYSGVITYVGKIGSCEIQLNPPKSACKIKKVETKEFKEVTETRYVLEGNCDPLYADVGEKE